MNRVNSTHLLPRVARASALLALSYLSPLLTHRFLPPTHRLPEGAQGHEEQEEVQVPIAHSKPSEEGDALGGERIPSTEGEASPSHDVAGADKTSTAGTSAP